MAMTTSVSSASSVWAIARREVRAYFTSPVGYVVLALFLFLAGVFFATIVRDTRTAAMIGPFSNIIVLLLFLSPIITMRLFAEEKKLGTLELLMTKPVNDWAVVVGKFLAALFYVLLMLVPTAIYVGVLFRYGNPDLGPILTGYLGVVLVAISFVSLGMFASVLTENQIIAVVLSFVFLLVFWVIDSLIGATATFAGATAFGYLSLSTHFDDFLRGVIDVKDVVYFVSFVAFWLFATTKVLGSRKWK